MMLFVLSMTYDNIDAQTLTDYYKTQSDISLTYDNNWNPIAKLSIRNISNKTITGVEIIVYYGGHQIPAVGRKDEQIVICRTNATIAPGATRLLTFYPQCGEYKPNSFSLHRIKYADGSICDNY